MLVQEIYNECVDDTFCLGVEQLDIIKKIFSADWLYLYMHDSEFVMEDLATRPDSSCSGKVLPVYYDNDLAEEEIRKRRVGVSDIDITVVGFRPDELIYEILKLGIDFVKVYYKYYNVVIDVTVLAQYC